ncbi:hypothetical protein RRG08_026947 [Elysia crispata]|uniref:Uncharacterized protein n=1 Tax=Elysia crispata TaxID=231223 RepID=A0AAE1D2U2_9GAST|nr:hypothetical protein RRG08_026947 [Elysia crispata]
MTGSSSHRLTRLDDADRQQLTQAHQAVFFWDRQLNKLTAEGKIVYVGLDTTYYVVPPIMHKIQMYLLRNWGLTNWITGKLPV